MLTFVMIITITILSGSTPDQRAGRPTFPGVEPQANVVRGRLPHE